MSVSRLRAGLAAAALALCGPVVHAEQVGRAEFALPTGDWLPLGTRDHALVFNGGEDSIPLHTAAFALPGPAKMPRALLVVTSTEASYHKKVRWVSETCAPARPRYFTNDYGSNVQVHRRECLLVNSAFSPSAYFAKDDWLLEALAQRGWKLFKSGYSIRTVVGNDTGTLLRVHLATQKDFIGLNGATREAVDLHDTPQTLVVWGESLHDSVRSSVHSIGGALQLPPIVFQSK
jgi:hypothetical protein